MVVSVKQCQYIHFGNSSQNDDFMFNGIKIPNSCEQKILGVK